MNRIFIIAFCISSLLCLMLSGQKQRLKQERDKYKENTETLIAGIHEYQIDSVKRAVEVGRLQFTVSELKKERSEYLEEINQLNFKVKQLQSMSVHKAEIDIPVNINIKDYKTDMLEGKPVSILASDKFKTVDISIENDVLAGKISLTANLKQYVYAQYKYKFLWLRWGVKGVNQIITCDNPYVKVVYSDYIEITKK